jgi:UDP-3-O-[3-hydroxymyristoyl] N-acetylglucosamine deacetylase
MNPGGLRAKDEPVRHKILDAIGDLALLGFPIEGRLIAERPGHGIIVALLREVEKQSDRWKTL